MHSVLVKVVMHSVLVKMVMHSVLVKVVMHSVLVKMVMLCLEQLKQVLLRQSFEDVVLTYDAAMHMCVPEL